MKACVSVRFTFMPGSRIGGLCRSRKRIFFLSAARSTEIYTLSLHDALPISWAVGRGVSRRRKPHPQGQRTRHHDGCVALRSEEHTSELQSRPHLVCRLLLEKKKRKTFLDRKLHPFYRHGDAALFLARQAGEI